MTDLSFLQLTDLQRPLLAGFYREQRSTMRASGEGQLWVARRNGTIVAGLNLNAVAEGHWLTGLLVAHEQRRGGIGSALLGHVLKAETRPVWLFCEPGLAGFYQRMGFLETDRLPEQLKSRLGRYQRSKSLLAMGTLAHSERT